MKTVLIIGLLGAGFAALMLASPSEPTNPAVIPASPPAPAPKPTPAPATESLAEVNEVRAKKGLPPFLKDEGLTQAAIGCAAYRAKHLIAGHTKNDFAFVPQGVSADAAGCAAWEPSWGWGACATYDSYRHAGAAWAMGRDHRRYMHLFVKGKR